MATRAYRFVSGVETSATPDPQNPSDSSDIVILSYLQANYAPSFPTITGSRGTPQSITAAGGISITAAVAEQLIFVKGNSGAVDVTATPQIQAGTVVGQKLELVGCSDTDTLQLDNGTGLELNGSCVLTNGDILKLLWTGSLWTERGRS